MSGHELGASVYCIHKDLALKRDDSNIIQRTSTYGIRDSQFTAHASRSSETALPSRSMG
jgi:hypothetical protein